MPFRFQAKELCSFRLGSDFRSSNFGLFLVIYLEPMASNQDRLSHIWRTDGRLVFSWTMPVWSRSRPSQTLTLGNTVNPYGCWLKWACVMRDIMPMYKIGTNHQLLQAFIVDGYNLSFMNNKILWSRLDFCKP